MTVRAHFDGKTFVPDEPVSLPKGAPVRLTVVAADGVLSDLAELAEQHPITDSPADWSEQHDHYIHAAPKR